jgi:surface protein
MKKLLLLSALLIFAFSYGQTPITDSNIAQAIETCLSTNPINGMCSDSEYGAMPDWDVSQVTDMSSSFEDRNNFNGDISSWVVSGVTNMNRMFQDATNFNGDISSWDVSNVTDMSSMFTYNFAFNQPIGDWDVSSVTDMSYMFHTASAFNQPIGDWDVSSVTDMSWMFHNAGSFVQDISSWCVSNITSEPTGFSNGTQNFPESYKPVWGTCPSLGIDDLNQLDVSIYPNPTSDTVYINSSSSQLKVVVFDILGKQVLNKPNTNSVDVSSLSKGAYFIKVSDGINTSTKKFIKE